VKLAFGPKAKETALEVRLKDELGRKDMIER